LTAGYWRLSGDDPGTPNIIEDWNPIFSRWPKWSELYLYTLFRERGVGYWTNLGSLQMEAGFSPREPLNCRFMLFRMTSAHPFPGDQSLYGTGTRRGDNLQARLDWKASPHWSGHVLYEAMLPGGFYAGRSHAHFLRFEVIYSVVGHWASH
jgi:hypothetical protein